MKRFLQRLRSGKGLPAFAAVVLGWMVLVILEGAVVRATGSGAGCGNHWPLCNGEVLPHHPRLATMIEFAHRSLTGVCTLLSAALICWTFQARAQGDRARRAAVFVGILLLTEGLLGAVLVKGGYVEQNTSDARVFVQCVHFTNTLLLLAAMTLTWWWLREPEATLPEVPAEARSVAWLAVAATMVAGATGSVAALADTLFPAPDLRSAIAADFSAASPLIIRTRWIHPASAALTILCVLWLCVRLSKGRRNFLLLLSAAQVILGTLDVLLLAPTWLQVLHLLGADLFWIGLVAVAADVSASSRLPRPVLLQTT